MHACSDAPWRAWRRAECSAWRALSVLPPGPCQLTDLLWFVCTPGLPLVKCTLLALRTRRVEVVEVEVVAMCSGKGERVGDGHGAARGEYGKTAVLH